MTEKEQDDLIIFRLKSIDKRLDLIDSKLWIMHGKAAATAAVVSIIIGVVFIVGAT